MVFYQKLGIASTPYKDKHPIKTISPKLGTSLLVIKAAINRPKQIKQPNIAITLFELIPPLFLRNIVIQLNLSIVY